jgi:hypothetical protein
MSDKQVIVTYSVLDGSYQNGALRFLRGLQDANAESDPPSP